MARPNGVVIVSERFWAFAAQDGGLRHGAMPRAAHAPRAIPLVRGLLSIAASLSPLFRAGGVAGPKERALLATGLLVPFGFVFLPGTLGTVVALALTAMLLGILFRGRTLALHGAEHRAIAAAEERRLEETWHGQALPSRLSWRCGTNFAALALPVSTGVELLWPLPIAPYTPFVLTVLSLAVTMEFWQAVQASSHAAARFFLLPGIGLQRITTREPELDETRLALTALASVLQRELALRA